MSPTFSTTTTSFLASLLCKVKTHLTVTVLLLICTSAFGKTEEGKKHFRQSILVGSEAIWTTQGLSETIGWNLRVSYGVEIGFNDKWAIMPGIDIHAWLPIKENGIQGCIPFIDINCQAKRHWLLLDNLTLSAGLGPSLLFMGYTEIEDDVRFFVPKYFVPHQVGVKSQVLLSLSDKWAFGFDANFGIIPIMAPEGIFWHSVGVCLGFRF